jgi:putative transposase
MVDIVPLLFCLHPEVTMTTIRQFSLIALAMLAMTGRVTMLGISRWTGDGASYRTVLAVLSDPPLPSRRRLSPRR